MAITLEQAQAKLDKAMAALDNAMEATSYQISGGSGGRSVSRASVGELQSAVDYWENRVKQLTNGGIRVRGAVPIDY